MRDWECARARAGRCWEAGAAAVHGPWLPLRPRGTRLELLDLAPVERVCERDLLFRPVLVLEHEGAVLAGRKRPELDDVDVVQRLVFRVKPLTNVSASMPCGEKRRSRYGP